MRTELVTTLKRHATELSDPRYRQIVEPPVRIFYRFDGATVYIVHLPRFESLLSLSHLLDED